MNEIILTDSSAKYFKEKLEAQPTMIGLRFGIKDSGCNAKKYHPTLTDTRLDNDVVFNSHGIDIFVNKMDLLYLAGTEIDFVREGINKVVKYNNPNVTSACGCGESFDIT